MSTNELTVPVPRSGVLVTDRVLGTLGMLAGPMMLAEILFFGFTQHGSNRVIGVLGTVYIAGWFCSAVGMRRARVTGDGALGKGAFVMQIVGLLLAFLWSVQEITYSGADRGGVFYGVTDAAWPLSHLFMLVIGILTLRAGVWKGWRRFAPLVVGLALPAGIAAASAAGQQAMGAAFGSMTAAGFLALGYAVRAQSGGPGRA